MGGESVAVAAPLFAQRAITSPLAQFGHNIGDDYFLANYTQMIDYWRKLDRESDRMRLVRIGTSADGNSAIGNGEGIFISSPPNGLGTVGVLIGGTAAGATNQITQEVNPANGPRVNAAGGKAFAEFMLAPETQQVIKTFGVDKYGQPLFVPIAGKKDEDFS